MDLDEMHSMSDEDFLQAAPPVEVQPTQEELDAEAARAAAEAAATPKEPTEEELAEQQRLADEQAATDSADQNAEDVQTEKTPEELEAERLAAEEAAKEPDYKALYEATQQPVTIKANGKEITLSNDELRQLAQQGANYTRKMQQLAPHRKTLMMLEENNLMDPNTLGYMIDLHRKDPAAIQKFLKESGINPLDVDVEAEPTYKGGNHQVSDTQVNFRAALDDARSTDAGMAVLTSIDSTWDQASKELLFKQPDILATMVSQREEGFYDRISAEMDRRRMLGTLPAGQSWLESYKTVGEQMANAGQFNDLVAPPAQQRQNETPAQQAPVVTRVPSAKQPSPAAAKAAAAAPTRVAAAPAKSVKNPLEMDDDEFLKQFANRL